MKIISGGQTGADRAALDVAIELGMEYGGAIPRGRLAEDGPIDAGKYPRLTELATADYIDRTKRNVLDADATLAFTDGTLTGGTKKTVDFAEEFGKPYLLVNLDQTAGREVVTAIVKWLARHKPQVLNVAGPRESGAPGIYAKVYSVLKKSFLPEN